MHAYGEKFLNSFWKHYVIWIFIFTAVYTLAHILFFANETGALFYTDTDPYTRALRIVDWLQNFQWPEKIFPYGNPPNGFVLHFTRICDVIWVLLSLPFMAFLPLKQAIFYGGMLFSPLFYALSIISLFWALRLYMPPLKNKTTIFFISVITAMLFFGKITDCFDFCRPDHHSFMGFVFCFNLATIMRNQLKVRSSEVLTAGILTACGTWASSAPEGFFVFLLFLTTLTFNWIYSHENLKIPLYYIIGFLIALTSAWLINPPYGGWRVIDNNRLSLIHCTIAAFIFCSFVITSKLNPLGKLKKLIVLSGCALVSVLLLFVIFGSSQILVPTYTKEVAKYFVPYVQEMKPIFYDKIYLVWFGLGLLSAVIWAYYTRLRLRYEKNLLFLQIITALFFLLITRFHIYFLGIFTAIYVLIFYIFASLSENKINYKYATFICLLIPIFFLMSFRYTPQNISYPKFTGIGLTQIFYAPRLVFEQNVDVIGFPYHTNPQGIINNYKLCYLSPDDDLQTILRQHNISFIYINRKAINIEPKSTYTNGICESSIDLNDKYPWMEKTADGAYKIHYE